MKIQGLLAAVSILLAAASCASDLDDETLNAIVTRGSTPLPVLSQFNVNIVASSATFKANYQEDASYKLRNYGFIYSTTQEVPPFEIGNGTLRRSVRNIDANGDFTMTVNLNTNTTYWSRAYAIVENLESAERDTIYTEVVQFTIEETPPVIQTMKVVNISKMGAAVFARFISPGNMPVSKFGICLSNHPHPTPDDYVEYTRDTCKIEGYQGEFGGFFEELTGSTLYYTRAFAQLKSKEIIYGEERIFRTSTGGDYSWQWAANYEGAVKAKANKRIEIAMDSAAYYYNNYSNLYLRVNVEYNEGVQTADCSFGGWIRFGKNERYQWVGTAQHETAHGLGVGTTWDWSEHFSGNVWQGKNAQRTLRAVMHDQSLDLHGDGQHFWPGGINQREEVTTGTSNNYGEYIKNERMLRANAMILNAFYLDDLYMP